jgi:hypothetical protein
MSIGALVALCMVFLSIRFLPRFVRSRQAKRQAKLDAIFEGRE